MDEFDIPELAHLVDPAGRDPGRDEPYGPERLGVHDPTHARKLEHRDREAKALELRLAGKSIRAIARELGQPEAYVANLLRNAVNRSIRRNAMSADQLREMQLRRLDMVIEALHQQVLAGNWRSIETYMRVMERQAKLTGMDAPERTHHTLDVTAQMSDAELLAQAKLHGFAVPPGALADQPRVRVRPLDDVPGRQPRAGSGSSESAGVHHPFPNSSGVPADPPGDGPAHGLEDGQPGPVGG